MTSAFSWQNSVFTLLHSVFQGQICLLLQVFLDSYSCIPVPYNEKDIFLGCQFQKVLQISTEPFNFISSVLLVGAQTWIIVILNGWSWKRTDIILLFLRLHPTTAFWTLLLTVQSFSIFGCKEYNQSDFGVDYLVMSMCRVFSCVVGRRCLL